MEVKLANAGLLTNIEVLELLLERKDRAASLPIPYELRACVNFGDETIAHIKETVSGSLALSEVRNRLSATKKLGLGLTEGEMVLIANHIPSQPVEVHMVSQDCLFRGFLSCLYDVIQRFVDISLSR